MLTRRSFLTQTTAMASGLCLGASPGPAWAQPVPVDSWGALPPGFFPGGDLMKPRYKVLEVHFYGGLSPWESFYVRPEKGFRGFETKIKDAQWHRGLGGLCSFTPEQPASTQAFDTTPFDTTDAGPSMQHPIYLGPATAPLWDADILERMRVVVLQHDLTPHEAAIPYAATGLKLGRPQMAGMGAAVQRRRNALDPARKTPAAYVCLSDQIAEGDNLRAFWSTGLLGGVQPVILRLGDGGAFLERLERGSVQDGGTTERFDDLLTAYRDAYQALVTPPRPPVGDPIKVRAKGFAEYDTALWMLRNARSLQQVLSQDLFKDILDSRCVTIPPQAVEKPVVNMPRMALTLAAALLRPPGDADYACVIDNGLTSPFDIAGYDTHNQQHVELTFANLYNTLASLRSLIKDKIINLDETLVVLSTEFGRTPFPSSGDRPTPTSDGRDHWPQGYVAALIGGPVARRDDVKDRKRRVLGRIGDGDGQAQEKDVFTATDLRAAAVMAAGIDPFTGDYINQGDLSKAVFTANEPQEETLKRLRSTFFGFA